MTTTIDQLPFDILFGICSDLLLDDVIHLSQTCRILRAVLDENSVCRRIVDSQHPQTTEAALAREGRLTYKEALLALYDKRHAFSNAYPFAARVVGQGNEFLHRQDTICILNGDVVHVSKIDSPVPVSQFRIRNIIITLLGSTRSSLGDFRIHLLNYSDDILVVRVELYSQPGISYIIALDTTATCPDTEVIESFRLESCSKLFVRHNKKYLIWGTHTGMGDDGHHKWELDWVSLGAHTPVNQGEAPILLDNFHGTDIGATVAFELFGDWFYAVSNQGTFEVEEIDYTSFYHFVSFQLQDQVPDNVVRVVGKDIVRNDRLYRRQHRQGPIHDSWTDLSLQLDESSKQIDSLSVMVVESRREWAQASSKQSRTFYITRPECESIHSEGSSSFDGSSQLQNGESSYSGPLLPPDDALAALVDSSNSPNYAPTPPLFSWGQHPEFGQHHPTDRSFILAKTKVRGYNYSCTSFLDLVEDGQCCDDSVRYSCLRIRVGNRREAPLDSVSETEQLQEIREPLGQQTEFVDNIKYRYSPIQMWPPPALRCPCSARLHKILNPLLHSSPYSGQVVTGVIEKSSLVYMVKPPRTYGPSDRTAKGTVILIDFSRPPGTNNKDAATASMKRKDSAMSHESIMSNDVSWTWYPGLERQCQQGLCH